MKVIETRAGAKFEPFELRCNSCQSQLQVESGAEVKYREVQGMRIWGDKRREFYIDCPVCFHDSVLRPMEVAKVSWVVREQAIKTYEEHKRQPHGGGDK